ncbi:patatin family protein [Sellimonas catena]|uniref:Patatin family protein n=1 Tax=Sellimonas catena TaxID=2994035 RepID=A0A9W6FB79_9FIRM|nr:patatin family protein [Drancourtella sp. An57]OUQ46025.1 patatin family protein [Drancourtella sp. An12]GLG02887.1 patatin family protein [Sellimonas catena]
MDERQNSQNNKLIPAVLVLEGGATRGVFTSGVLDFLMEKDFYTTDVIGVSAGACNAIDYVSRQIGRTKKCMIHKEKEYDFYLGLRKMVKEKSMMDMDLIFDRYPKELIPFDFDTYFQSEMKCDQVVTNCETGKAEYLDERKEKERLLKICRASSSMPLAAPIVRIDGVPYLDGGLADSVPIERALKKGRKKIIVILTRNEGYRKKKPSLGETRIYRAAYKKYPNLVRTILRRPYVYNKQMEQIEQLERKGEIFVLRPKIKTIGRMEKNYDRLTSFYEHGYVQMKEEYERLLEYLNK